MRGTNDWDPGIYGRFRGLRLRPALDLLGQVGDLPLGTVVDLGCGDGAVGPLLRARWPDRRIVGVDASPAMCAAAQATGCYDTVDRADVAGWAADGPVALIFSNAALQWMPDHATLIPQLAGSIAAGGMLAIQMPRQYRAPSHRLLREIASDMFPDRFDWQGWQAPVAEPHDYLRVASGLGTTDVWETIYHQRLQPGGAGHPVRRFTEATAMRPFVERMSTGEAADFVQRYETALNAVYAPEDDGSVLFPFRRLFLTIKV